MNLKQEYNVKLELFEGPLDLLLYLVTRSEVDIVDISVSTISKQYLKYLDAMRELKIDIASDYLSMAATLIRLKARELLPPSESENLDDDEGIINRQQLIDQLLEYKKFKEAADSLRHYESENFGSFSRGVAEKIETTESENEISFGSINVYDLISAFQRVVERAKNKSEEDENRTVTAEPVKLDDRIEVVLAMLEDDNEIPFERLFEDDSRRMVLVVTFMAILELTKMQEITFRQERSLGNIFIKRRKEKDKDRVSLQDKNYESENSFTNSQD